MFVDEKSELEIFATPNWSVIHGTHRPQDLIPAFLAVIRSTPEYLQISVPSYATEDESSDWWDGEECFFILEELFDVLDSYSPTNHYFGAHQGDGSDFGYWYFEAEEGDE